MVLDHIASPSAGGTRALPHVEILMIEGTEKGLLEGPEGDGGGDYIYPRNRLFRKRSVLGCFDILPKLGHLARPR